MAANLQPGNHRPGRVEERISRLLVGAVDMHCHSGPSVMARDINHIQAMREASTRVFRAMLIKDHYYSASSITEMLNQAYAHLNVTMFSGVPLTTRSAGSTSTPSITASRSAPSSCGCRRSRRRITASRATASRPASRTRSRSCCRSISSTSPRRQRQRQGRAQGDPRPHCAERCHPRGRPCAHLGDLSRSSRKPGSAA